MGIGDDGAAALTRILPATNLTVLRLDHNKIGSQGGSWFALCFADCLRLKCIVLSDNKLTENTKVSLDIAWNGAGKQLQRVFAKQWFTLPMHERMHFDTVELEKNGGIIV